jgi:hypothetical protein
LDKHTADFHSSFQNCLVKLNISSGSIAVANPDLYDIIRLEQNGNLVNKNPDFQNINRNMLNIGADSFAKGAGIDGGIQYDILHNLRTNPFDIGAYNWITFPDPG